MDWQKTLLQEIKQRHQEPITLEEFDELTEQLMEWYPDNRRLHETIHEMREGLVSSSP